MAGGPPGAKRLGVPGTVTFTSADGAGRSAMVRAVVHAAADGTFTATVMPGPYSVTARSPRYQRGEGLCRAAGSVMVTASGGPVTVACVVR